MKFTIMKKNIGVLDKVLRVGIAIFIAILLYFKIIEGQLVTYILSLLSGILIVTSLIDFCPLYLVFNISSKRKGAEN